MTSVRCAGVGFIAVTTLYAGALLYLDLNNPVFDKLDALLGMLPAALAFSFLSYIARFVRRRWLLARRGFAMPRIAGVATY